MPHSRRLELALILPLALVTLFISACDHYIPPDTHTAQTFRVDLPEAPPIALAVWDQRPDVLSGSRVPEWIAVQRQLYGIPIGQVTKSGKPLAGDMATLLESSLERSGADVEVVEAPLRSRREDILADLAATGRGRLVLLRMDQWYDDAFLQSTLHYDLTLEVFDPAGKPLASATLAGGDDLGKEMREGRKDPNDATADILKTLLTRKRIQTALTGMEMSDEAAADDEAADDRSCTVQQILQMRDSGLSESQIEAACGES